MSNKEELKEAVLSNISYLTEIEDLDILIGFIGAVGESVSDGQLLEDLAEVIIDLREEM